MFKYETHCHTCESSACAKAAAAEVARHYTEKGYAGFWVTDHFVTGDTRTSWEERVMKLYTGFLAASDEAKKLGTDCFFGWEYTRRDQGGTDFLTYGLTVEWLLAHPEADEMRIKDYLDFALSEGALIFQAHPFREAGYIEMIRLLPRSVTGVEVLNANRTDFENAMAEKYASDYGLMRFAGSDNHLAGGQKRHCGILLSEPAHSAAEWCDAVRNGSFTLFDDKGDK